MKKVCIVLAVVMCMIAIAGCSSAPEAREPDELDMRIREASDYLNERIPSGSKVVFLYIASNYPDLSDYILSELSSNAVNDEVFSSVDRQELDAIRAELHFQYSGEVSDASAQEIGAMLGAQTIVFGAIRKISSLYRLEVKAIEVQSTGIQGQKNWNIPHSATIAALTELSLDSMVNSRVSAGRTETVQESSETAAVKPMESENPAYNVGDTGPAGGLIFYDKGNNAGGWRYLEAATADIDRQLPFVTEPIDASDAMERGVGRGQANTNAVMKDAAMKGGGFGWAAQACDAYSANGFDDWFLPSRDELHYMYGHLHMEGLGDFKNERYVSSTSDNRTGTYVWTEHFQTGDQDTRMTASGSYNAMRVRPIRQF
jgi:TolB-like protein